MVTAGGTDRGRPVPGRRTWIVAGLTALATIGFLALALLVRADHGPVLTLDHRVADRLHRLALAHPDLVTLEKLISTIFSPDVFRILAVVAGIVLWRRQEHRLAAVVVVAVLGTGLWSSVGKLVVNRDRPSFAHPVASAGGQSYPSGHALTSFVACGVALVLCSAVARRRLLLPAVVVVAAVGSSRLLLGVHYLSDVVGGWLLGTAWLGATLLLVRLLVRRRAEGPVARPGADRAS